MPGRPTTPGAFPRAALFAASMSLMTNNFSITNLFPYVRDTTPHLYIHHMTL